MRLYQSRLCPVIYFKFFARQLQVLQPRTESVRFEVSTAVTMKNVVFWDIKPIPYLTRDTLRLLYRAQQVNSIRFEAFTAVTMKNAGFWDIKTQHFTSALQGPAS
jgi:hypothetical protein